jgi:serine protease Do
MRYLFLTVCFYLCFCESAHASYSQSKDWFYSQSYEDRIALQLLLIFSGDYVAIVDATFGKRTYEAILGFQYRNGFPTDGVLNDRELDQLMAEGGSVMEEVGFEFRDVPNTGITLGIPENLFVSMEATQRGVRWTGRNKIIELETLRIPHYETIMAYEMPLGGGIHRISSLDPVLLVHSFVQYSVWMTKDVCVRETFMPVRHQQKN